MKLINLWNSLPWDVVITISSDGLRRELDNIMEVRPICGC